MVSTRTVWRPKIRPPNIGGSLPVRRDIASQQHPFRAFGSRVPPWLFSGNLQIGFTKRLRPFGLNSLNHKSNLCRRTTIPGQFIHRGNEAAYRAVGGVEQLTYDGSVATVVFQGGHKAPQESTVAACQCTRVDSGTGGFDRLSCFKNVDIGLVNIYQGVVCLMLNATVITTIVGGPRALPGRAISLANHP